jgi:hypothetical protein
LRTTPLPAQTFPRAKKFPAFSLPFSKEIHMAKTLFANVHYPGTWQGFFPSIFRLPFFRCFLAMLGAHASIGGDSYTSKLGLEQASMPPIDMIDYELGI